MMIMKENKFDIINRKPELNIDFNLNQCYHSSMNSDDDDKEIDYTNLYDHTETAIESISESFIADYYDSRSPHTGTGGSCLFVLF